MNPGAHASDRRGTREPIVPIVSIEPAQLAFRKACWLDVAVRKPGNVSFASPGHGMQAAQFVASSEAAAAPLCARGARVGTRIEAAVRASWAAAGCNTNLGIVLLCAPLAAAAEGLAAAGQVTDRISLRQATLAVLADLDQDDAAAAFRAIALAQPGGLGTAPAQDVRQVPSVDLRCAMALAADRDRIARQYALGFADVFDIGLAGLLPQAPALRDWALDRRVPTALRRAVLRTHLGFLAAFPDSHIVRKRGAAPAQSVMQMARDGWAGEDHDPVRLARWDESLKAEGCNPGTTADLTVASLMAAALLTPGTG